MIWCFSYYYFIAFAHLRARFLLCEENRRPASGQLRDQQGKLHLKVIKPHMVSRNAVRFNVGRGHDKSSGY
jgi:hypothetical protein